MALANTNRIESIDLLRGVVMVLMALDHARDFFGDFFANPTDLSTTTPILFFTRFATHFCAPVFVFLAGTSAFLYGQHKPRPVLAKFLLTRGLWLILLEFVLNDFLWNFDITYSRILFQVIWVLGFSMIALSLFIYLPTKIMLACGILIVAGHNLLDSIRFPDNSAQYVGWYVLHQESYLEFNNGNAVMLFMYPALPWFGILLLGYCFGYFYTDKVDTIIRRKWLTALGIGCLALFCLLRGINVYGDMFPWSEQKNGLYTLMSFINISKYPPSLDFVLLTLGPALLFLSVMETRKGKVIDYLLTFGKVPLFYYFLHILVIHLLALVVLLVMSGNWKLMIITKEFFETVQPQSYVYPLWVTYLVWVSVVVALYPLARMYMHYKARNKSKWWLSYL